MDWFLTEDVEEYSFTDAHSRLVCAGKEGSLDAGRDEE